jgi:uncharacterized repeat protein (TIGR01451 family)
MKHPAARSPRQWGRPLRSAVALAIVAATTAILATAGASAITPTSSASDLASAIVQDSSAVTGASFVTSPPTGTPNAVSTTPLTGFPTAGASYAILTTGDATLADQPNNSGSSGADDGGDNVRGDTDFDVSILKIDLNVPTGVNCLSFDFRFLSEEYPEYVNSDFNDAFIAELDNSTWTTSGSTISAPNNFAFDPSGDVISINSSGATSMTAANADGTTYDGATPPLGASTPITAGAHSLYLSIFDQGDNILDSAVFVDNLVLGTTAGGTCKAGATVLSAAKTADSPTTVAGGSNGYTITINNPGGSAASVDSISDVLPAGFTYIPASTTGGTTTDPAISSQTLTWAGPFTLPANGSISLHFGVTVSSTPGDYFNNAGAAMSGGSVSPTGPTAPIEVTAPTQVDSIAASCAGDVLHADATASGEIGSQFDITLYQKTGSADYSSTGQSATFSLTSTGATHYTHDFDVSTLTADSYKVVASTGTESNVVSGSTCGPGGEIPEAPAALLLPLSLLGLLGIAAGALYLRRRKPHEG